MTCCVKCLGIYRSRKMLDSANNYVESLCRIETCKASNYHRKCHQAKLRNHFLKYLVIIFYFGCNSFKSTTLTTPCCKQGSGVNINKYIVTWLPVSYSLTIWSLFTIPNSPCLLTLLTNFINARAKMHSRLVQLISCWPSWNNFETWNRNYFLSKYKYFDDMIQIRSYQWILFSLCFCNSMGTYLTLLIRFPKEI